jgi:hypothetical protein
MNFGGIQRSNLANKSPAPMQSFLVAPANAAVNAAANIVNTVNNAAKNTARNMGNFVKNNTMGAFNAANSMANSLKETPIGPVVTPLQNSVKASFNAVPDSAPSLFFSLPLIIGIGVLVVLLTLVIVFKDQVAAGANSIVNAIRTALGYTGQTIDVAVNKAEEGVEEVGKQLNLIETIAPSRKQVFNIAENTYTYTDAEPLCKALGAELATYDQVKEAWGRGADWCNYGWIKGQGAVYPTQQTTFDKLQQGSNDDERLACGQPGINGGYFDNPELRFGVNCYGDKPSESDHDMKRVLENQVPPLTAGGLASLKKELRFRQERDQIGVLPFRENAWSQ